MKKLETELEEMKRKNEGSKARLAEEENSSSPDGHIVIHLDGVIFNQEKEIKRIENRISRIRNR